MWVVRENLTVDFAIMSGRCAAHDGKTVEDTAALVKLFFGIKSDDGNRPVYHMYRITFEGNGKRKILYPAGSGHGTVLNKNGKCYFMGY